MKTIILLQVVLLVICKQCSKKKYKPLVVVNHNSIEFIGVDD